MGKTNATNKFTITTTFMKLSVSKDVDFEALAEDAMTGDSRKAMKFLRGRAITKKTVRLQSP